MRGSALPGLQSNRGQISITVSHFTHRTLSTHYLDIIYTISTLYRSDMNFHLGFPQTTFPGSSGTPGILRLYPRSVLEPLATFIWCVKVLLWLIHYVFIVFFVSFFGGRQHQFNHSLFIIFPSHLFIVTWWMIILFTVSTKYAFI